MGSPSDLARFFGQTTPHIDSPSPGRRIRSPTASPSKRAPRFSPQKRHHAALSAHTSRFADLPPEFLNTVLVQLPLVDRVVASLVCRRWRSTALASPCLWQAIKLRSRGVESLLEDFLPRSKDLPLYLELVVLSGLKLPYLQTHAERIRLLDVSSPINLPPAASICLTTAMPSLRILRLAVPKLRTDHFTIPGTLFQQQSPSLTEVTLTNVVFPDDPCPAFSELHIFRYILSQPVSTLTLPHIFSTCSSLQHLSLDIPAFQGNRAPHASSPSLLSVSLKLQKSVKGALALFLNPRSFPALRDVFLSDCVSGRCLDDIATPADTMSIAAPAELQLIFRNGTRLHIGHVYDLEFGGIIPTELQRLAVPSSLLAKVHMDGAAGALSDIVLTVDNLRRPAGGARLRCPALRQVQLVARSGRVVRVSDAAVQRFLAQAMESPPLDVIYDSTVVVVDTDNERAAT